MRLMAARAAAERATMTPGNRPLETFDQPWIVARPQPGMDALVALSVAAAGCPYFLPLRPRRGKPGPPVPLYGGYVFIGGDAEARYAAIGTWALVAGCPFIDVPEASQSYLRTELLRVEQEIIRGHYRDAVFVVGDIVRVVSGSLMGATGTVVASRGDGRVTLQTEMLGGATMDDFAESNLELAES